MFSLFSALQGPDHALCLFHSLNFVCVLVDHHVWLLNFIHVCMCGAPVCVQVDMSVHVVPHLAFRVRVSPRSGTHHPREASHGAPWTMSHLPGTGITGAYHTLSFFYLGFESPRLGPHSHSARTPQAEPSLQPPFPGFFPPRILFLPLTQCGPKVTLPALKSVFDSALVTFGGNGSEITPSSWES